MLSHPLRLSGECNGTRIRVKWINSHVMLCVGRLPTADSYCRPNYFCPFLLFRQWLRGICLADSPEGSSLCLSVPQENQERQKMSWWRRSSSNCWSDRGISAEYFQCLCFTRTRISCCTLFGQKIVKNIYLSQIYRAYGGSSKRKYK